MHTEQVIAATEKWITSVVIGCNFCPFAAREMQQNSIHYHLEESGEKATCLLTLIQQCERLDAEASTETIFIIFPNAFQQFQSYLTLISLSEKLLAKQGYEGIYQIASFHPGYRFSGAAVNDAANYTNRSPYPMLQLLREESIEKALAHYPSSPGSIPDRNIAFARSKGLAYMQALTKDFSNQ